ncbi:MAG: hypothetical protein EZS28_009981, partial [Streblomastix strix]
MANFRKIEDERKDCFFLETLALPGEIQSMVVGRFFDKNIESLVLAKSTFLSIFHSNETEGNFDFVDHICVYKEVYCLCTSVQPHSLDCLFVLSVGGEWLLLQWNKTRFFPLASGSLLKSIQPLMKQPEQRRFRLDPTFQWAVSVVPITDNSPHFFTRPTPKQSGKQFSSTTKPLVRISFRAVIVVDETVFVGVKYDGPDAKILSVMKNNWAATLKQFPVKFGFFDAENKHGYKEENVNTIIRNGLEEEWKVLQSIEQTKKNLCIANADTFIFFEDDEDQPNYVSQEEEKKKRINNLQQQRRKKIKNPVQLYQIVIQVRHLTFTTAMKLEPFPIRKKPYIMPSFPFADPLSRERDGEVAGPGLDASENKGRIQLPEFVTQKQSTIKSKHDLNEDDIQLNIINNNSNPIPKQDIESTNQSCTSAIALVDTPSGLSLFSLLFDFEHHRISLHSFIFAAIAPSAARLMTVLDEDRVIKTLRGEEITTLDRVHAFDINTVKGALNISSEFLNQYYSNLKFTNNDDEYEDGFDEMENIYTPPTQTNSTSQTPNTDPINNIKKQSSSPRFSINRLHKHITRQQFKTNTIIITFPNKTIHLQKKSGSRFDVDSSEEESQVSNTTGTDSSENADKYNLILEQSEQCDDGEQNQLIFARNSSDMNNSLITNEPIQNFHPFLLITAIGVTLFTSHLTKLHFIFPITIRQPPMCVLYVGGQHQESKQIPSPSHKHTSPRNNNSKKIQRHKAHRDFRSVDKLFVVSGRAVYIICNGQVTLQYYPFRWFNELAMTNGANWFLSTVPKSHSSQSLSSSDHLFDQEQSSQSQHSSLDEIDDENEQDNIQLKIGLSMLFIISSANSSMIVDMSSGAFYNFPGKDSSLKELGEGGPDDFQSSPMSVISVVPIPNFTFSHYHSMEDRFVLGTGNGRTGALHSISVGNRLQTIMHGKWYEVLPTLFTTKAYAGAKLHSLLLVEEEKTIDIEKEQNIIKSKEENTKETIKQPTYYPDKQAQALKQGENLRVCYSSTVFTLREDIVEPIDASAVGIDNSKQTLALGGANGAFVQITSAEVRIIPTLRFSATVSSQKQYSHNGQQNLINLNKSLILQNDQQEKQNDDQKQVQQKEEQSWEILSEYVGYDVQQGILWPAPFLQSEEQCKQKLLNIQQNKSTSSINSSINQNHKYNQSSQKDDDTKQRVVFECGCISDNLIAVSYKCVVFVLVWNPSKPKFTTSGISHQQSSSQRSITQLPAIIHPVATLCFPSPVKALAASTICTRSFLVVGCESPPAVFLYRLDTIRIAQQSETSRNQLWTESEKLLNNVKYQIVYPTVLQPNSSLVIQNGNKNDNNENQSENKFTINLGKGNDCSIISSETDNKQEQELKPKRQLQSRYIEVLSGSHQYVEVQYSSNAVMTRIFDLFPYDKPEQIVFTTFNRQVRIYSQKELEASDLDPVYGYSHIRQTCAQNTLQIGEESLISKRRYFRNEGAVLMIAGHNGQLATTIAPLGVLLDFPPEQPNNDQLLNTAQFFFPSLVTTMRVYPQRVKMAEDEGIVYVFGDRISALTWNNIACKIFWTDLENAGMMHSLVPMRVADEQPSLIFNVDEDEKSLLFSEDNSQQGSLLSAIGESSHKTDIPHPIIAWIDYLEQKLTFGTINKRRMVTRDIKDVSSQPLAIAHIPNMHAIAILCREHSSYPYDNAVEEYQQEQYSQNNKISTLKQKEYNDRKQIEQGVVQYKGSGITGSLMGLGLDVTGIVGNDSQMYMPFHDLYTNYLQERENIKNRNAISEISYQSKSPISKSTTTEQLNNEQNIKKKVESNLKLSIQYFHESVPDRDSKGEPFVDVAADWFIESHKNQFKDYRPKRLPPYKLNTSKINLSYSMKSNFAQAFPEHLSPLNIQKALKKNNLFFNNLKKQLVSTTKNDLLLLNNNLKQPPKLNRKVEINEQLPLPSKNRQQPFDAIPPEQFSTLLSSDPKTDEQLKIKENKIEFNGEIFEQYVKTVTNPFMIILYDESEMRLRIGDLNLSHLNLDFGKSSNELQKQSPKQDEQNSEQQYGDIHKLDTEVISTQLYNFFSMICVTMPTQQGFNEIQKILRENINELEQASNELGFDTQQMDKAEKIYKELDESEFRVDASQIQNLIKLQNQLNINNNTHQGEQSIQDAQTGIQTNLWQASQTQQINQIDEKIDENELTKLQDHLRGKNEEENTKTKYDERNSMLMPQQTGTYYDRYARSFLCVVGRESVVGLSSDNSPFRSNLNSPFQSHLFVDIEEEPFYESMVTDIFIFEVDRHHILGNARFKARQLLEKQIDEYCLDKDGNVINQEELIHFTDEQIQKSLDESEFLNVSHFDSSTSVMTTIYDKLQLLNIQLTLYKRIRILGGVQAIYGYPSTLVVLNGCHAFVFLLGPRLDDKEVSTISKIYNLKGNEKSAQLNPQQKNDEQQMNKKSQYIHTVNGDGQQQLNDETCTCTTPLYTDEGKLFPTLPQHASIRNVRNITDSKGNLKLKYRITLPKMRQFYVYNNNTSAVPTKSVESYALHNPYTFNIRLVTQIIAPSPITQIQLQIAQYKSYLSTFPPAVQAFTGINEYSTFRGIAMDHKMLNLIPSFMLPPHYLRASVVFSPNGFAFVDLYYGKSPQANSIMRFQLPRICVYNPKDVEIFENSMRLLKESLKIKNIKPKRLKMKKMKIINSIKQVVKYNTPENITNYYANTPPVILAYVKKQDTEMIELLNGSIMPLAFAQRRCRHQKMIQIQQNSIGNYLTDVIEPKVVATDSITSQLILPPLNGTDLASAAGIYLKHRYRDLVKTAAMYGQLSKLIAQAYAPSIIIDASPLGINQFGLVSDNEVLIYVLLPNPL